MTVEKIKTGYTIAENARLLRRFASLERRMLRILAGWLPEIPEWEVKKAVARHIWDSAQHAAWLRSRLVELRGGRADADAEPGLVRVLDEALHAPNTAALIAGLYLEIKQQYLKALRYYCQTTSYVVDSPTADILERIALVEERHLQWAKTAYEGLSRDPEVHRAAETWRSYIVSLIDSTGGFHLLRLQSAPAPAIPEVYTPFRRSMKARRDERFDVRPASQVYKEQKDMNQEPFEESVITNFKIYATEMWAAELVASCLFDAPADLPWDFFYDLAHQCWDEARHAEMGEVRLAELGVSLSDFPTAVSEYERGVRMPMLHRFCDLTIMAEAEHIHVRRPRMEKYLQSGDLRSAEFVDYDWSDEINHVRYGFKWVKYLLEEDARSLDDLKAEVWEMRHQLAKENPDFTLPPYFKMDE